MKVTDNILGRVIDYWDNRINYGDNVSGKVIAISDDHESVTVLDPNGVTRWNVRAKLIAPWSLE